MYPENFRYTKEHEWVSVEGDIATVGITDHAQAELGDIVYVDLPRAGAVVVQGKALGSVESVKAVSDVYSPVSGTVLEGNAALGDNPGLVNEEPEGDGWFFKLTLSDPEELQGLMDETAYAAFVAKL